MRLTRFHLFLLGGLFMMILGPLALTQPGPDRGGNDRKKGDRSEKMFAMLSGGKETITVSTVQIPEFMQRFETAEQTKEKMMAFLQKKGVSDGVMTKALYSEYSTERMAEMRAKWGDKKRGALGTPPMAITISPVAAPGSTPVTSDPDAAAKNAFKLLDKNGDGVLSVEEMQTARQMGSRILDEREKWDTNKNGTIELSEYIEYYKSRNGSSKSPPPPAPTDPAKQPEEDPRPIVYRVGKLPKGLPAWFTELDQDKDGQVGLYEWKASGRPIGEFLALDHNGDGFITVEEVLRDQKANAKKVSPSTSKDSPSATPSPGQDDPTRGRGNGNRRRENRNRGN